MPGITGPNGAPSTIPHGPTAVWGYSPDNCPYPDHRHESNPRQHASHFEIKSLQEFQGYFTTDEGTDFPVTVVANNIEEATKILRMPGAFKPNPVEPTMVKFLRGNIGVSRPIHNIGFDLHIYPEGAIISGAYATPQHFDVVNGDNVIFSAFEPFGWKFTGFYKGFRDQPIDQWVLLSNKKVAEIDVYDPYLTRLEYIAKYEFAPALRNGRYMDIVNGQMFDFKFDGYGNYPGYVVYSPDTVNAYYWSASVIDEATTTINCIADPLVTQPENIPVVFTYTPSPIGINLVVQTISVTNPFNWSIGTILSLRWIQDKGIANHF